MIEQIGHDNKNNDELNYDKKNEDELYLANQLGSWID